MAPIKAQADLCRMVQIAITTRQAMTPVKKSPLNMNLASALYKANLISWYTQGNSHRPPASAIACYTPDELTKMRFAIEPSWKTRIWIGMKYANDEEKTPAMRRIIPCRKPGGSDILHHAGLRELLEGKDFGNFSGLRPGELLFVETDSRIMECQEALEEGLEMAKVVCKTTPFAHDKIGAATTVADNAAARHDAVEGVLVS